MIVENQAVFTPGRCAVLEAYGGGSHSCVNGNVLLEMWFCGGQGNVMIAHPQGRREHVTSRGVDICVVKGAAACEEIRQLELVDLEGVSVMSYSNSTELQGIKFLSRVSEKTASQPQADYVVRRGKSLQDLRSRARTENFYKGCWNKNNGEVAAHICIR